MSNTLTLEALLNKIITLSESIISALEANKIHDAETYYSERLEYMDILGRIKTSDVTNLPNYELFIRTLVRFDQKFNLCA
jgi:hypothetical protein